MNNTRTLASYWDRDLRRDVELQERSDRKWFYVTDGETCKGFSQYADALASYNRRKAQHQGE